MPEASPIFGRPIRTEGEIAAGITPADYSFPPGNVRRYGATGDGVTDDLPAFEMAHDQFNPSTHVSFGGVITIPQGMYFLDGTWRIQKEVHIVGAGAGARFETSPSSLIFPKNKDGLRLHSSAENGFNSASNSTIRDLFLYCNEQLGAGSGVNSTTRVFMRNVHIQNFARYGVKIFGGSANGTGSPNQWSLIECDIQNNGNSGLYVQGPDSNAGNAIACNFKSNGGWGVEDLSFLGNSYVGCHLNDNAVGSIRSIGQSNESVFISCYVEAAGNSAADIDPPAQIIGGNLKDRVTGDVGRLGHDGTSGGFVTNRTRFRTMAASDRAGFIGLCAESNGLISGEVEGSSGKINFLRWNEQFQTYDTAMNNSNASTNISRQIVTDQTPVTIGGRPGGLHPGSIVYPNGIWIGFNANARFFGSAPALPTSGEYATGDYIENINPVKTGSPEYIVIGWKRVTTGSGHVLGVDWIEQKSETGS